MSYTINDPNFIIKQGLFELSQLKDKIIMEQTIKIIGVKVNKYNITLKVFSTADININDMLSIEYAGDHYFKAVEVEVCDKGIIAHAEEKGYWAHKLVRNKDLNYKDLIGKEMSIVRDEETIKKIELDSSLI